MPLLAYSYPPFVPFTVIKSHEVNAKYDDIKLLLNVTKLDDVNIQDQGITRATKLIDTTPNYLIINDNGGAMSEFAPGALNTILASNGPGLQPKWITNSAFGIYNIIIGSSTDVSNATANYASFASYGAVAADGDNVLLLNSYVTVENVSINKKISITGQSKQATITGTFTYTSGSTRAIVANLSITGNVTMNSGATEAMLFEAIIGGDITVSAGADGAMITHTVQAITKNLLVDSTVTGEYLWITQEI